LAEGVFFEPKKVLFDGDLGLLVGELLGELLLSGLDSLGELLPREKSFMEVGGEEGEEEGGLGGMTVTKYNVSCWCFTKERAQEFITRRLLIPLGLTRTTWTPLSNSVNGYRYEEDEKKYYVEQPLGDGYFSPMGGLWSTIEDLSIWVTFLLDGFSEEVTFMNPEPLCKASRREMQRVCNPFEPKQFNGVAIGYGMGLRISYTTAAGWIIAHSGGLPGFGSNMIWSLKHRIGIIALGNITYCPLLNANLTSLEILLSSLPDPFPKKIPSHIEEISHRLINVLSIWAKGMEVDKPNLDNLFSMNIFLDMDLSHRKRNALRFCGFLPFEISSIRVKNNAMADIELKSSGLIISFLLTPVHPLKIQSYNFSCQILQ